MNIEATDKKRLFVQKYNREINRFIDFLKDESKKIPASKVLYSFSKTSNLYKISLEDENGMEKCSFCMVLYDTEGGFEIEYADYHMYLFNGDMPYYLEFQTSVDELKYFEKNQDLEKAIQFYKDKTVDSFIANGYR